MLVEILHAIHISKIEFLLESKVSNEIFIISLHCLHGIGMTCIKISILQTIAHI